MTSVCVSIILYSEHGENKMGDPNPKEKLFNDEELVVLIDPILSTDDTDNDGYINYAEFIQAQRNAAATSRQ